MFDFNKPKIEITEISDDKKYGRFVVEPLERGYGITLGNSLRRIMLSSLPGAAVSQVKIEGVLHEFSSLHGCSVFSHCSDAFIIFSALEGPQEEISKTASGIC